jgi:Tfp pilus assembly protein PilV
MNFPTPRTCRPCPPRGMALMAVVMMFVLIGVAVLSMTLLFQTEIRRTRATVNGAQLRQLLLAGAAAATDDLRTVGPTDRDRIIKVPLAGAALAFHITPNGSDAATLHITATLRDSRAAQTLQLTRAANGTWNPTATALQE